MGVQVGQQVFGHARRHTGSQAAEGKKGRRQAEEKNGRHAGRKETGTIEYAH